MTKLSNILFLSIIILSASSCAMSKMGKYMSQHKTNLQAVLGKNVAPQEKLDAVALSFVNAMEESLTYTQTKHSVKHIDQYSSKNKPELDQLFGDIEKWYDGMSQPQKMMTLASLATKPYTQKLITLVPKFERKVNRKIQTFKLASKLIGVVTPKL